MKPVSHELISQLPKVELHCHLDGSLRTTSILEQAEIDNVKLPFQKYSNLDNYLRIGKKRGSLEDYIKRFMDDMSTLENNSGGGVLTINYF